MAFKPNISRALQTSIGVGLALSPLSTLATRAQDGADSAQKHENLISTLNNAIELAAIAKQLTAIANTTVR
jgi:hypothetical protein